MFGLGMGELLVILAVALLVLGPKRLPEMATGLGKAIRDFRRATQDIQSQLETDASVAKPLAELKSALQDPPSAATRPKPVAPPDDVVAASAGPVAVPAPVAVASEAPATETATQPAPAAKA
jgi:Tat protein translocase TatB subunit